MYNREILEAIIKLDMPRPMKLTYLAFARFARADGREIWPGNEAIAADLHCTERQIKRDMGRLVNEGWLIADGKVGYTNRYRVNRTKLGLPEVPLEKAKVRGKVHLEPTGAAPPLPDLNGQAPPDTPMLRNMERMNRSISSYWRLRQSKNPDAWLSEPGREDIAAFLREYQAMVTRLDPDAGRFELGAMYAQQILAERKGAKV